MPSKTTPTAAKKKTPRAKVGGTSARVEQMRREVFRMLNEGMSCPQIGDVLGISRERAWQLGNEEMAVVKAESHSLALDYRVRLTARHESRINKLQRVIDDPRSEPGLVVTAIDKQRGCDIEIGKLWGAYAPAKSELSGPDGGPIQAQGAFAVPIGTTDPAAWAAAALAQSAGEEAEAERVLTAKPKS
jgi:hypothetical protein